MTTERLLTAGREKSQRPTGMMSEERQRGLAGKARRIDMRDKGAENQIIVSEIIQFIDQIRYGEVVVTIHDSRVVQIEKREKRRFHNDS